MNRTDPHHAGLVLDIVRSPSGAGVSEIAASWCRSVLNHGLDPESESRRSRLEQRRLTSLRDQHADLLAVAGPVLDQMFRTVGKSGCGVILSDRNGVILDRRVGDGDADGFADVGLVEGGIWSEAEEGTNGIGTCLVEARPLVILRDQHFASRNIGISCMDAPVHAPDGQVIAALDVSSCRDEHGVAAADMIGALVRDAARRIERDYFCRHFTGNRILLLADDAATGTALLAVDRDGLVIGASRAAVAKLGMDTALSWEPRPLDQLLGTDDTPSFGDGERAVLRQALATTGGNASKAARLLGIGRATLYRRITRAGLKA